MTRFPTLLPPAMLAALLSLAACGGEQAPTVPDTTAAVEASTAEDPAAADALTGLLDRFFEAQLELLPLSATSIGDDRYNDRLAIRISDDWRERFRRLNQRFLDEVLTIDRGSLAYQDRLSYDLFRLQREQALESLAFPSHLQPFNQFYSMPSTFVRLGSGAGSHPFRTVKDYEDFLSRTEDFTVYVDTAIANMRRGMEQGVVLPAVLVDKLIPQLTSQVVDNAEDSSFYTPVVNMPETFADADRERLTRAYVDAIENRIIPTYERLANFFADDYSAAARSTVGMLDLPGGDAWYAFLVRRYTTTDLTPDEIHQIGLDEVARIHGEMQGVMDQVGFDGDLQDFFAFMNEDPQFYFSEPEQLIDGYRAMADDVAAKARALFDIEPKTAFEVRAVEAFRERSSSAGSYSSGTPDGSRPGIFYANTYRIETRAKWAMESLFLHEAIPGHHFQIALQREADYLPRFRRFSGVTAYTEGWGLYAETLGRELGMYSDPYSYFGALNAELWRAIRLVVDTGLHAKGWSRQDVLDYMFANSAVPENRAVAEAERFMAIPGQALAYKIGQLKIREIRDAAEARLGDAFDVVAFHREVLKDGPLPLSMLESKIDAWVDAQL